MATSAQMKSLIDSHAAGDDDRFYAVALQVAARAARAGQTKYAVELRDLIDEAQSKAAVMAPVVDLPLQNHPGNDLFERRDPRLTLSDLTLPKHLGDKLREIVVEQFQSARLASYGLEPSRKLLLTGPPGTGKTSTAEALAAELNLPFLTLKLDRLITRYMGETAAKLGVAFELIRAQRAVYLFDEVDALAGERADSNDVGEMRRILNSFLQFIDDDDSMSVLIAATNHPQLLDSAFFRRFDELLYFEKPSLEQAQTILKEQLLPFDTTAVEWGALGKVANGLSQAQLRAAARNAAKEAILFGSGEVNTDQLYRALRSKKVVTNVGERKSI